MAFGLLLSLFAVSVGYMILRYVTPSWKVLLMIPRETIQLPSNKSLDKYGWIRWSKQLLKPTLYLTTDPQHIQAIYSTDFHSYGVGPLRHFPFGPLIGSGTMNTDGPAWEASRALLRPIFTRSQVNDLAMLERHVQNLIRKIPRDSSTVDLQLLFACMDLDYSTEFIFGESAASLTSESTLDAKAFLEAYNTAQVGIAYRASIPRWNIFHSDKVFWNCCKIVHDYVDRAVARALLQRGSGAHKSDPDNTKHILVYDLIERISDPLRLRNQLMNVFLPGHDSTAILISNVFFALARHPAVYSRLRNEVLGLGPGPDGDGVAITTDALKRLSYLQAVINETLRLYPPVTGMSRAALKNAQLPTGSGLDGAAPVFLPHGSVVLINYKALHRRRDLWGADADVFRPERWLAGEGADTGEGEGTKKPAPAPWTFVPFSGGPRTCPGQQRALAECAYVVTRLLRTFRAVENRDPVWEYHDLYKLVTESKNGVKVALEWA